MLLGKFYRRHRGLLVSLSGMIMLIGLLICAAPVMAAEKSVTAAPEAKTAPCKGLKPYNNLDELLYQFYINLDSDCLFEMPVGDLEKIWGITILTEERAKPKAYYPLSETEFYNKPYKSEKDAFYVEIVPLVKVNPYEKKDPSYHARVFLIKISKAYLDKFGTLDPGDDDPLRVLKPGRPASNHKLSVFCNDTQSEILIKRQLK